MVMLLGITRDIFEILYIEYARMNNNIYIYFLYNEKKHQRAENRLIVMGLW
jgi:hypothetical protein